MGAQRDAVAVAPSCFDIVVSGTPPRRHAAAYAEIAETLVVAVGALGYRARIAPGAYGPDCNIVFGRALAEPGMAAPPPRSIVYNLEQFGNGSPWFPPQVRAALGACVVWDYSARNLERMQAAGLVAKGMHVPIGYVPELTRIAPAPAQDIDVLFYGSINPRRATVLRALSAAGLKVAHAFGVYGARRDALIARAKVVLNLHYYDAAVFEVVRVSYLLANAKAVVAECGPTTEIDPDLRDAVAAVPYESLVDTAVALCRDERRREELGRRGLAAMQARPMTALLAPALARLPWPLRSAVTDPD